MAPDFRQRRPVLGPERVVPRSACPKCSATFELARSTHGGDDPEPGAIVVCIHCGFLSVYDENLLPRLMAAEAEDLLPKDVLLHIAQLRKAIAEAQTSQASKDSRVRKGGRRYGA